MNQTETTYNVHTSSGTKIKSMVITALFIALVYVGCMINIQLPFGGKGGLIHLGNIPLFIGAILFGKKTGAIAGGIGMALFDLLSPFSAWAPFTFVIVACMGFVTGAIAEKKKGFFWYLLAMLPALAIKLVGYYFAEVILYGNWTVPFASIPGNIIQVGTAIVVVLAIVTPLNKMAKHILR